MTRDLPIISFGPNDWSGPWMNRQEILSRLADRGWLVLYSTGPRHLWEYGEQDWKDSPLLSYIEKSGGVLVDKPGRLMSRWPRVASWDEIVCRGFARRMCRAISCSPGDPFIAYLFDPRFFPYVAALQPRYVAFHLYDYFHFGDDSNASRDGASCLAALARRADLITYAGPFMDQCLPASEQSRARLLANGTNAAAYSAGAEQPCPEDLARLPTPRIGFVGNITPKVDLALVMDLAARSPQWHWVFVGLPNFRANSLGPEHARLWEGCLARPNIHWLGPKPHGSLPAYAGHMDVHALPYRVGAPGMTWTRFMNPLKLYSALATGRPVVSVALASIVSLRHVVDTAETIDEWEAALSRALASGGVGTPQLRQAVAYENSWDARIDELDAWLLALEG